MILILGASGIVGQHLRLTQPKDVSVIYTSTRQSLPRDFPLTLRDEGDVEILLDRWWPSVVINLTGENRPDVVEKNPDAYVFANALVPRYLAAWCRFQGRRLIHVSTQGVLSGTCAPYSPYTLDSKPPVNAYGRQKLQAELEVIERGGLVARLTFILGIRPFPHVGRPNPLEQMISNVVEARQNQQVYDRLFSVCFAADAAKFLWQLALGPRRLGVVHIGTPVPMNRYKLAQQVAITLVDGWWQNDQDLILSKAKAEAVALNHITPVQHDVAFPATAWAQRPVDTTYSEEGALFSRYVDAGIEEAIRVDWRRRLDYYDQQDRATEIATFLNLTVEDAAARLAQGFGFNHGKVAESFRQSSAEASHERLLEWYRGTDAYIWELTAYHLDPGFNYRGMCQGIIDHLVARGCQRVLCLGDGVGDLTILAREAGLSPTYNDLLGSKTSNFAAFRIARRQFDPSPTFLLTGTWAPISLEDWENPVLFDAVIALDFFEHLVDVEGWVRALYDMLRPGGLFLAQNAFHMGNEPGGSLPMHLTLNDHYEKDWDPLMDGIGYVRTGEGNWRVKPA